MIKTILLGVDGSEHAATAERYALWMAKHLGGTVVGLHVVDIISIEGSFFHDISGSMGFEPYLDFSSKMREALYERGGNILKEFAERAEAAGVAHDTRLVIGVIANEIAEHAKTADLVAIGHRGVNEKFSTGLLGSTAESVARKCPTPLLVSKGSFETPKSALLAYDGSRRAASAMHVAAECCTSLDLALTVLTVADDDETAENRIADARKYLAPHDLNVTFETRTGPAPETIAARIDSGKFDLLFIGAYGHNRILELVLGSTTEFVLRNSSCPIFLNR